MTSAPAGAGAGARSAAGEGLTGSNLDVSAAAAAATADDVPVVVTAVDADGELVFHQVDADEAAAVVAELAAELEVVAVEADVSVSVAASHIPPSDPLAGLQWPHQTYPFSSTWVCGSGAGVTVAVVDTGVAAGHRDFGGRVLPGVSILEGVTTPGAGGVDPHGHGTHVAGIVAAGTGDNFGVAGVAPNVTVMPVRTLAADGNGYMSDIAAGIVWAVDHGADVVNLSLGGDAPTSALNAAVSYASSAGVVLVAAAGNGGPWGATQFPAALPDVIAVASITSSGTVSAFSTHGTYVDVAAPGSGVHSTWPDGGHRLSSGTSQAAPHVAGVAAALISAGADPSPAAIAARITSSAVDAGPVGFDSGYGHGILSPLAAFAANP